MPTPEECSVTLSFQDEVNITAGKPELPPVSPNGVAKILDGVKTDLRYMNEPEQPGGDSEFKRVILPILRRTVGTSLSTLDVVLPIRENLSWRDVAEEKGEPPETPVVHPSGVAEVVDWIARDLQRLKELDRDGGYDIFNPHARYVYLRSNVDARADVLNAVLPLHGGLDWENVGEQKRHQNAVADEVAIFLRRQNEL